MGNEYNVYKTKRADELASKEKANRQQMEVIKKLLKELKMAKQVIVNPNIKNNLTDRLKESEEGETPTSKSVSHAKYRLPAAPPPKTRESKYMSKYTDRGKQIF